MRRVAAVVLALALAACATLPPGSGPNQQLLNTWGTSLAVTIASANTIHTLAAAGCATSAPAPIRIQRSVCLKLDTSGAAIEVLIHEAGTDLADAKAGKPVNPAMVFARLAIEAARLYAAASEGSVKWSS